jgi:hypothetical protein
MSEGNGHVSLDQARTALLNGFIRKNKLFTTEEGTTIEVRQPTVGQRSRMLQAGGLNASNANVNDIGSMQVAAVIECCYHPGSGKRLFQWTDEEVISNLPTSSWFDEVAGIAMDLMNTEPSEAGKPSSKTEKDEASFSSPASSEKQSQSLKEV